MHISHIIVFHLAIYLFFSLAVMQSFSAVKKSILLVATSKDSASLNIAKNLLKYKVWNNISPNAVPLYEEIPVDSNGEFKSNIAFWGRSLIGDSVFLWLQNLPLLRLDFPDKIFKDSLTDEFRSTQIDEIIFLSKHAAASGTKSLTVHPIGWFVFRRYLHRILHEPCKNCRNTAYN